MFVGEVLDVEHPRHFLHLTFRVLFGWKGVVREPIVTVLTADDAGECGYPFPSTPVHIIYAHHQRDDLVLSSCSRSHPLKDLASDGDVIELGNPPVVFQDASTRESRPEAGTHDGAGSGTVPAG